MAKSTSFKELVNKVVVELSSPVKDAHVHPNVEDVAYRTLSCSSRIPVATGTDAKMMNCF